MKNKQLNNILDTIMIKLKELKKALLIEKRHNKEYEVKRAYQIAFNIIKHDIRKFDIETVFYDLKDIRKLLNIYTTIKKPICNLLLDLNNYIVTYQKIKYDYTL